LIVGRDFVRLSSNLADLFLETGVLLAERGNLVLKLLA